MEGAENERNQARLNSLLTVHVSLDLYRESMCSSMNPTSYL